MRRSLLDLSLARVLALLVLAGVSVFLVTALFGLFNPRDTSQPEGAVVAAALRMARGEPLYLDLSKGPYITAMYGPLIYAILGGMVKATGAGVEGAYLAGRLLSLFSALAAACLVTHLSRRHGASRPAAWIAGGLFLASPLILPMAYSARSDLPALALDLAGVALFVRWAGSPLWILSALPLVAAAFTKQTALAPVLAIALALAWDRKPKRGLAFALAVAVSCAAILGMLVLSTGGLAAVNLLEVPGASPLSVVSRPLGSLAQFLGAAALPLILIAPVFPRLIGADPALRLPLCYAAASILISTAASAKLGSDSYYFMEPLAAILILSSAGLTFLLGAGEHRLGEGQALLTAGLFAVLLAGSAGTTARMGEYRYRSNRDVIRLAAAAPGEVLIEDENVALKCGKPVTIMDPFAFAYLSRRGRWDAEPLNRRILERAFGVIILRSPVEHPSHYQDETYWADTTLAAIGRAYRSDGTVDGYVIYRPRAEDRTLAREGSSS
jgi:hypothetical protein